MLARQLAAVAERARLVADAASPRTPATPAPTCRPPAPNLGRDAAARLVRASNALPLPVAAPPQGAEPLLFAAADPAADNGGYYGPAGRFELTGPPAPPASRPGARDTAVAARLWAVAEDLTGRHPPRPHPALITAGP